MAAWDPEPPRSADPSLSLPPQGDLVLRKFFSEANFPTLDKKNSISRILPLYTRAREGGRSRNLPLSFPTIPHYGTDRQGRP